MSQNWEGDSDIGNFDLKASIIKVQRNRLSSTFINLMGRWEMWINKPGPNVYSQLPWCL